MIRSHEVLVLAGVLGVVGCAAASSQGEAGGRRSTNVITAEEIASVSASSAYEVVQRLRSQWLLVRGGLGSEGIVVYVDGVRRGDANSLRDIPVEQVRELRWIDGKDATTRYGTGHGSGVIEVYTKR